MLDYTNAGAKNIKSKSRKLEYASERHFVCWLAKHELGMHEKTIASLLGGRERTTIISSIQAADAMIKFPINVNNYSKKLYERALKVIESKRNQSVNN